MILYELLTGQKPFTGETISSLMFAIIKDDPTQPSAVDAKVHAAWDEILGKALAKEPRRALRLGQGDGPGGPGRSRFLRAAGAERRPDEGRHREPGDDSRWRL